MTTFLTSVFRQTTMSIPPLIHAGMPSITLSDVAGMRLQSISFFLMGFLLAAWGIKAIWNVLRRDWPALPRLSYPAALGMTALWGLMFVLVLTMISGTRELLTPGAWEKQGATYKLKSPTPKPPPAEAPLIQSRREHLRALGTKLLVFAAAHSGQFPTDDDLSEMGPDAWKLPKRSASQYRYLSEARPGTREQILAYEPAVYGDNPFVQLASGEVVRMTTDELAKRLPIEGDAP